MVDRLNNSDIKINNITIERRNGSEKLEIVPGKVEGGIEVLIFESLGIQESITQNGISGVLMFRETGQFGDYFNIIGNEYVHINFESPGIEKSDHDLTFCIDNVTFLGDEAIDALDGPSGRAGVGWQVDFISCENFLLNWEELDYMDTDFIGPIAGDDGFVNRMATKYFNPGAHDFSKSKKDMDIEKTYNSVWLKKNQNMYPWGKEVHAPNLGNLMNNLAENSVTDDDQMGVNYLFYADFDGWHFKSIRSMIKESAGYFFGMFGGPREYIITDTDIDEEEWNNHGDPRIISHSAGSDYDHLRLWNEGAYSSYYELVRPDYEDPYFDYIDFTTQHSSPSTMSGLDGTAIGWGARKIIDYDYHRDADLWGEQNVGGRVEKYKLLHEEVKTEINKKDPNNIDKKSRRKYDESGLYGYFQSPYSYYNEKSLDFLGSSALQGKHGKQNDILWQTMFDQTDLEMKTIKTIQEDIKQPTAKNYQKHIELMNLKEKFNVYRHSICCDKQSVKNFVFLALIYDAKKVQGDDRGGIYEYSWKEIEMWPTDFVETIDGGATQVETSGSPLKIVHPKDAMSGEVRSNDWATEEWTNPAYNLNELMNRQTENNVYVGPGVNSADSEYNDYPEAYQMMPIGGYFEVVDDMLVDPCEMEDVDDGPVEGIQDGPWSYPTDGHIVQMYRIPNYILGKLNKDDEVVRGAIVPMEEDPQDPDPKIPKDVFFFDVPNAHDGLCGCVS